MRLISVARFETRQRLTYLNTVRTKLCWTILIAMPAMAGEYAVLSSGARIHIERHERSADIIRLYTKDGFTELPANAVTGFEEDDYVPPPPNPPPAAPVAAPAVLPNPKTLLRADPKTLLRDAAIRYVLPPAFVESVAKIESAMRLDAVSPKGAVGVMQLMPATARALAADPNDAAQNIDAGTRLLRELLIRYDGDVVKALAAYNAGSGAVDLYQGLPPFPETRDYVNKVIRQYQKGGGQ
jgi:soluble lytic murein transglycosylase-like protein